MATIKTTVTDGGADNGKVRYHVTNPAGEHYEMRLDSSGGSLTGYLIIGSASNFIVLSQTNLSDLATAFSGFGSAAR